MATTHNVSQSGSKSEPETLISSCAGLLARRDFTGCQKFIQKIPRSDPNISLQVDQILTIAEVLSAARNRFSDSNLDWYSILQLRRREDAANRDLVRQQFKTLVRLLDPNKNKFPFAEDALMRVREAWFVISDPARRACFDREIGRKMRSCSGGDAPNEGGAVSSFWTMCPYCWYLHEYEKKYEGCSLRCGNCRKTFHGVAVKPPAPDMVVKGKEQYYCYEVSLPLRYPTGERRRFSFDDVRERVVVGDGRTEFQSNGNKRMRIKTVANRVRMKGFIEANRDSDSDAEGGDVL